MNFVMPTARIYFVCSAKASGAIRAVVLFICCKFFKFFFLQQKVLQFFQNENFATKVVAKFLK
jgi:hypothetical protein